MTSPLQAIHEMLNEGSNHPPLPEKQTMFDFSIDYPTAKFSSLSPMTFNAKVDWRKKNDTVIAALVIDGVTLPVIDGVEEFFEQLTEEVNPFIKPEPKAGKLAPLGALGNDSIVLPGFYFGLCCSGEDMTPLQESFSKTLYGRAVLSLFMTRAIYTYIAATGELPPRVERDRLLLLRYGEYQVHLLKTGVDSVQLPAGMYLHRGQNLHKPH